MVKSKASCVVSNFSSQQFVSLKGLTFLLIRLDPRRGEDNIQVLYVNVHCQIIQLLQKIILNIKMHKVQFFSVSATITNLLIRCLNLLQNNSAGKEIKGS